MSFTRARALQSLQNGLRQSSARPALRSNAFRRAQLQAKRFASSEHGHQSSSDLPWLLGALIVTPPSVYYLWPAAHSDHHDDHSEHKDDAEHDEDKPVEEESGDDDAEVKEATEESAPAEKSEEKPAKESKSDDKQDKDEEQKDDTPAKKDKDEEQKDDKPAKREKDVPASGEGESKPAESSGNVEGVNFKGKVKEGSDAANHTKKVEDDNKGEKKKRIDSGLAKNLGPGHEQPGSELDQTTQDGKQKGLSNTQSRHSVPIHESDEKSKKPDGTPDTSKTIGTVDPGKTGK